MKILISSHRFSPDIGGIEVSSAALAAEFHRLGHEIRLITETGAHDGIAWPFPVIRNPGVGALLEHAGWCDVFFQNNISLQNLWAAFLRRRPWVVAHQTWFNLTGQAPDWRAKLKRFLLRFGSNVAISRSMAEHTGVQCRIVGNPYRDNLFFLQPEVVRDRDLVYLGRLVSDKGVDTLLHAVGQLKERALRPKLTIVGSGPEEENLRGLTSSLGLEEQVVFAGPQTGEPLARLLNAHRIMVVPSRWAEPFGIVALEGIACGCAVVGSAEGGLSDAIGPCGLCFTNGDSSALAAVLSRLLTEKETIDQLRAGAEEHLSRHTVGAVAAAYLEVFTSASR